MKSANRAERDVADPWLTGGRSRHPLSQFRFSGKLLHQLRNSNQPALAKYPEVDISRMNNMAIQRQFSFTDAGAFCDATQGFDVEFQQLDRGNLDASLSFMVGTGCVIQHVYLSRRFHQRGSGPADTLTFGLPDEQTLRNWCGRPFDQASLLNFSGRCSYDSVSESGFSAYTISIDDRVLEEELDALGSTIRSTDIRTSDDWNLPDAGVREQLRAISQQLVSDASTFSGRQTRFAELQSSLVHILAQVITADETINDRANARQRDRAVGRALDLIFNRPDSISVSDLAAHSGVCWRTLDRAFQERFGIGPKQFMVATRLSSVRRALQSAPTDRTITEIATEWGFSHLGRFSFDYKQMFGELPSRTARK